MIGDCFLADLIIKNYQKSSEYKSGCEISKNKSVKIYNNISEYENIIDKKTINESAKKMERLGLLKIKWMDYDNIIERIIYKTGTIEDIYKISSIVPNYYILKIYENRLRLVLAEISTAWIERFIIDSIDYIKKQKKCPKMIKEYFDGYLMCLKGIDELIINKKTILERVFSKKYLGNSKAFKKIYRRKIVSFIKKYGENIEKEVSDGEILSQIGIESTSSEIYLKGDISLNINNTTVTLKDFIHGVGLNSETLEAAEIENINCDNVVIFENKTNFTAETSKNSNDIIIFSSGFFSQIQISFIKKIYEYSGNNIKYYHSGDIDLGGFKIFNTIKEKAIPSLISKDMNVEIFRRYRIYAEPIEDKNYLNKLIAMKNNTKYYNFIDILEEIIFTREVLEQEAFLI